MHDVSASGAFRVVQDSAAGCTSLDLLGDGCKLDGGEPVIDDRADEWASAEEHARGVGVFVEESQWPASTTPRTTVSSAKK